MSCCAERSKHRPGVEKFAKLGKLSDTIAAFVVCCILLVTGAIFFSLAKFTPPLFALIVALPPGGALGGMFAFYKKEDLPLLTERGLILKKGTIVDSTLISAPSSTKNREKKRDPDAHFVKKGNTWHFGYKAHVGVDKDTGLVHHVEVTSANIHDVTMAAQLLTGEETTVYGDSGYLRAEKRKEGVFQILCKRE